MALSHSTDPRFPLNAQSIPQSIQPSSCFRSLVLLLLNTNSIPIDPWIQQDLAGYWLRNSTFTSFAQYYGWEDLAVGETFASNGKGILSDAFEAHLYALDDYGDSHPSFQPIVKEWVRRLCDPLVRPGLAYTRSPPSTNKILFRHTILFDEETESEDPTYVAEEEEEGEGAMGCDVI